MNDPLEPDQQLIHRLQTIQPLLNLHPIPWDILCEQAEKTGCSPRTIQRWMKLYYEKGEDGLRSAVPKKKHGKHGDWKVFIRKRVLSPRRPSIAKVHSDCIKKAHQDKSSSPSYSTVRRIVYEIPKSVKCYYRNRKEFRDKYQVIGELYQATYPGELYLMDHQKMDVLVLVDPRRGKNAKRPWITAVLDQYSRSLVGYYIGFEEPSSRRIALALRHAILPQNDPAWPMCGIPAKLRHDHGSDLLSQHIKQVKIDLHISDFSTEYGNPKSNAEMERFFGTLAEWEKSLDGWTGSSLKERPEKIKPALDLKILDRHFQRFIKEYHGKIHSTTKMTPFDRWNTGLIPQLPESREALDILLMPVSRQHKIRRDGIHFKSNRYWSDDLILFIGETCFIRFDPLRLEEIIVYVNSKRIGSAFIIPQTRQSYNVHCARKKQQKKLIQNYAQKTKTRSDYSEEEPGQAHNTPETETDSLIATYLRQSLERDDQCEKELKDDHIILFPVSEEGDDWC